MIKNIPLSKILYEQNLEEARKFKDLEIYSYPYEVCVYINYYIDLLYNNNKKYRKYSREFLSEALDKLIKKYITNLIKEYAINEYIYYLSENISEDIFIKHICLKYKNIAISFSDDAYFEIKGDKLIKKGSYENYLKTHTVDESKITDLLIFVDLKSIIKNNPDFKTKKLPLSELNAYVEETIDSNLSSLKLKDVIEELFELVEQDDLNDFIIKNAEDFLKKYKKLMSA